MNLDEVKELLKSIKQDDIELDPHFYKRIRERPINEGLVRSLIVKFNKLERIEYGKEGSNRFKLWIKMSNRYDLVVIIEVLDSKGLKIISAWNTCRRWQKQLKT